MYYTTGTIEEIKFRVALAQEQGEDLHKRVQQLKTYIQAAREYLEKAREEPARFGGQTPLSMSLTQSNPELLKLNALVR